MRPASSGSFRANRGGGGGGGGTQGSGGNGGSGVVIVRYSVPTEVATEVTSTDFIYQGLALQSLSATQTGGESQKSWKITYLYDEYGRPYGGVYRDPADTSSPVFFGMVVTDRGDVVELLDANGDPFAAYRYDAWGNPIGAGNLGTGIWTQTTTLITDQALADAIATRQPLRYASYCFDSESGMYYLSSRHYDPQTRQFLSKDLSRNDGEESAYQYCLGNPVSRVDPTGFSDMYSGLARLSNLTSRDWDAVRARQRREEAARRAAASARRPGTVIRFPTSLTITDQTEYLTRVLTTTVGHLKKLDDDYWTGSWPPARESPVVVARGKMYRDGDWDFVKQRQTGQVKPNVVNMMFNDIPMSREDWGNFSNGVIAEALGIPRIVSAASKLDAIGDGILHPSKFVAEIKNEWGADQEMFWRGVDYASKIIAAAEPTDAFYRRSYFEGDY
jgi:RHS repeat-associated protein